VDRHRRGDGGRQRSLFSEAVDSGPARGSPAEAVGGVPPADPARGLDEGPKAESGPEPTDLARFYRALVDGKGEFTNGVRLVYPMEQQAMQLANLLGNKFFSVAFSWLLGQPVKDTLCGTKVLWKGDYQAIATNRSYFGEFDPFGDFDLLFGAARLNLKIAEVPIRYRERTYGTTNIRRWRHGWLLLKMVAFGAGRVKFV